jgi:hypothetical protein
MKEKIEFIGYWNFDSDKENTYSGNLIVDNNITLTLLGCIDIPKESFIIHGTSTSGKKITLMKCFASSRTMSFPGIPTAIITANYYFNGEHLNLNSNLFNTAILKISHLEKWIDIGGFEVISKNDDKPYTAKYKNPEAISFYNNENVEFSFVFFSETPLSTPKHNLTIKQETLLLIKHQNSFDLENFWEYLSMLKSFLTLAYFSEPQIQEIKFKQADNIIEFRYSGQFEGNIKEKSNSRSFLFTYKKIESDFNDIFKSWVELNKTIEPVVNTLQECFGNRTILIENKFLNVIQGIETFHRRMRKNYKESKEVHKKRIIDIIDSCPTDYKEWLQARLDFSNEPTLHSRLENLFDEIDNDLKNHLFPNTENIILQAKNSRNYYTHYDAILEKKALKGADLFYLTERLKIFLLVILLKETSISNDKASLIIKESSNSLFNHLISK